jgi:NADP-dependent 3-hydroxy acid dehydrogenase YdfG/acyl carrier protein
VLVPRVAAAPETETTAPDLTTGTVLVTGGTGGLGALVATHLVEQHGVRDLLLTSRRGPEAAGAAELVTELERRGATVRVAACDVADRRALTALLASVPADRPLVGVVHSAGVLEDSTVEGLTPERLDAVLRPKVEGGWLLHELTADRPLAAFVLFSSVAGVLGTLGQSGYAAANAFLDALARHRTDHGQPAVSVDWGLWSLPTGLTGGLSTTDRSRLSGSGLAELPATDGLALLDQALTATGPVLAARWDLAGVRARAESGGEVPAVLRGLVRPRRQAAAPVPAAGPVPAADSATAPDGFAVRLAGLRRSDAAATVRDLVRSQVAAALGHGSAAAVEVDTPFSEMGLDSLTGVELRNRLSRETGLRLPTTLVFSQPTVVGLSDYLLRELLPAPAAPDELLRRTLEQVTAQVSGDEDRDRVLAVLRAAVTALDGRDGAAGGGRIGAAGGRSEAAGGRSETAGGRDQAGPEEVGDELAALSDDEMFQFIDTQL